MNAEPFFRMMAAGEQSHNPGHVTGHDRIAKKQLDIS
jgi:hypothetical protein